MSSTTRLEAFSDGVFAIAATLLVLDLKVPDVKHGLVHALDAQWPSYASFVVSFLIIGTIWTNHHAAFEHIVRIDRRLLFLNLGLLLTVALIPFPTAILAKYLHAGHDEAAAAAVYSGFMAAMGMAFGALWSYAVREHRLLGTSLSPAEAAALRRRFVIGAPAYLVAIGVAFVSAPACLILNALLAVYYAMPTRGGAIPHAAERREAAA